VSETTLSVPEIHCGHCKTSIEGAVSALPGVARAEVDVEARTVSVTFDEPAGLEAIVSAIEDQGYSVPPQG
jgi:copper chaperone